MCRQASGVQYIILTRMDLNNYLRDKRKTTLFHNEMVNILRYFCQQAIYNISFHHAEQIDNKQDINNIFWTDKQIVIDCPIWRGDYFWHKQRI